jgi:DNA-binding transcriptional regulator YhcF (GntR family)
MVYRASVSYVTFVGIWHTAYKFGDRRSEVPWRDDGYAGIWTHVDTSEIEADGIVPPYLQVASNVRWHIIQWQLPVGTPLPPETDLAELYGVSRDTVRRAYDILRRYGMIATRRGAGTFVKSRPDMQYVRAAHGSRITTVMRAALSPVAMEALTPAGRSLYSPVITIEEPGKPPAYYDSASTVISVWDENA